MHPSFGEVLLACVAVIAGCAGCAYALWAAQRGRNWLWLITSVGAAAFVAGVVGQRVFPSDDLVKAIGPDAASRAHPGAWDAGVSIPATGLKLTPVALVGLLIAVAGIAMVLFFEVVPDPDRPAPPETTLRPLEEDDAV